MTGPEIEFRDLQVIGRRSVRVGAVGIVPKLARGLVVYDAVVFLVGDIVRAGAELASLQGPTVPSSTASSLLKTLA
jgi:hypothetical protein